MFRRLRSLLLELDFKSFNFLVLGQVLVGLLDIVGIFCLGNLVALGMNFNESSNSYLEKLTSLLGIPSPSKEQLFLILGINAALFLISRTILSVLLTKKTFSLLASKSSDYSKKKLQHVFSVNVNDLFFIKSSDISHALSAGIERSVIGMIGPAITLLADLSLLLLLLVFLTIINASMSILMSIYFLLVAVLAHKLGTLKSSRESIRLSHLTSEGNASILNLIKNYRETRVRGTLDYFLEEIVRNRKRSAISYSIVSYVPYIGKYLLELSVIIGALAFAGFQYFTGENSNLIAESAMFVAAASRIAPAVLRVQQGILQIKASDSFSRHSITLLEELELKATFSKDNMKVTNSVESTQFFPKIELQKVSYSYDNQPELLDSVSIAFSKKKLIGIYGQSGSGKSTFLDLILGLIEPTDGNVTISDLPPGQALELFRGKIAYVPQEVTITNGTVLENIVHGRNPEEIDLERVKECLERAQLSSLLEESAHGLQTLIGENGKQISGGERQRIGLGRALYTKPEILILDEVTSSLDSNTEDKILEEIAKLKSDMMILMVSHSLNAISKADLILYLNKNNFVEFANFESFRKFTNRFNLTLN